MTDTDSAVIDLQMRIAYQEDILQTLSDTVARQQRQIDALQAALRDLLDRVKRLGDGGSQGPSPADERPPHY